MIYTPADVVLLTFVALGRLRVVSGLLLLLRCLPLSAVVKLAWSVLAISLGTTVCIVSRFTTPVASITTGGSSGIVSHRCACRGTLAILLKVGALYWLTGMLSLLLLLPLWVEARVLTLPDVDILSP
jgi:hypothetical protein